MTATDGARRVILLGSTGSIGTSTLDVIEHLTQHGLASFEIVGLAAGTQIERLAGQAKRWDVPHVAASDPAAATRLGSSATHVHTGPDAAAALVDAVARPGDLVIAAMVGAAGVPATLAAIERGCDVALANKETLVAAGAVVMPLVRAKGVQLLPIDSEHSAIAQCLRSGRRPEEVRRIVLTASGGPFRTWPSERLATVTVEDALNHPTWKMGNKITIDSATLMNKALEIIEAHWLFDLPADQIDAIVHPQSVVHSFAEFVDGSVLAQLSPPDMRGPIQYALTGGDDGDRVDGCAPVMDWTGLRELTFEPVDHERFPAITLALDVIRAGGTAGAILNAANECAVAAFLAGQVPFPAIAQSVRATLERIKPRPVAGLEDVLQADTEARGVAEAILAEAAPGTTGSPGLSRAVR